MIELRLTYLKLTARELAILKSLARYCQKEKGDERIRREEDKIAVYKPRHVTSEITDITASNALFIIRKIKEELGEIGVSYNTERVQFPSQPEGRRSSVGVLRFPVDIVNRVEKLIKKKRLVIVDKRTRDRRTRDKRTYEYVGKGEVLGFSKLGKSDLEILKMLAGYCKSREIKTNRNMISLIHPAKIVSDLTANYGVKVQSTSFPKFIKKIIRELNRVGVEINYSSKPIREGKHTKLSAFLEFPIDLIEQIEELISKGILEIKGE